MTLDKPEHLRPDGDWLARHVAGVVALALGAVAFLVVAITQEPLWSTPDPRISVPGFVATAIAATASIARRERAYPLWLGGIGLAGAALVLGWFLMLAVIIAATAVLILILHSVM
ncbi:MAG: hypothetical protein JO257_25465 [Deltaproteobacteria bacterium]|nr:hypothetical protein [Deltaproteobacteria bacterium]